jgi:GTP-binding protein HflX
MAEDKLFATLDPTTRRRALPSGREVLITDTVGFINNLPTLLIAAFRATLEEINEATILIHVVDVTHPNVPEQVQTVLDVLEELGADNMPIVTALNKIDAIDDGKVADVEIDQLVYRLGPAADLAFNPVAISAQEHLGFDRLLAQVETAIEADDEFVPVTLTLPFARTDLVDRFHQLGRVEQRSYDETGTTLQGVLPARELGRFTPYIAQRPDHDPSVATPERLASPGGR